MLSLSGFRCWWHKLLLLGLLSALFVALILTAVTRNAMRDLPNDFNALTRAELKPQLLDRNGRPLTITYQNKWNAHEVLALHDIPLFLQHAFILAEDKRFYSHSGIDWAARFKALWQNVMALRGVRGASTISEQAVRMIHQRPRSIWARWVEGWEARELEAKFDKATIFEFYLNQVPYAAQRRGVQQAASYYFDRDLDTLSQKEMLALAVLVRAPSRFDLHKSTERIEGRLTNLLDRAVMHGLVAQREPVINQTLLVSNPAPMLDVAHFASRVYRQTGVDAHQVKTTLDSNLQHTAQELLNKRLASLQSKRVQHAGMLVLDHQTDEVLVWAVGESNEAAAYDTVLVKRQPGSTLKPFVYASAMEKGWTPATMIDDSPLKEAVGRGVHAYRNYSNTYYGELPLRNALGNSLNIPAIKAAKYVGVKPLLDKLSQLGIKDLNLRSVDYGNGIALGNGELSLYSLVGAYASLARKGEYRPLKEVAGPMAATASQVFSPEVSSLIGNILSDADARSLEFGRGGVLNLPVQTAVKTGTSNGYRDAWVVGYNHRYVIGVWMGNLNNEPMDQITGSRGPALVMRSMFAELNRNQETQALFLSRKLQQHNVCIKSGLLSNGDCATRKEWFLPDKMPSMESTKVANNSYALAQPIDQMLVARDPRIPDESEALEFKLNDENGVRKVEWYVNDELVASTIAARYYWSLEEGQHKVIAKVFREDSVEAITTQQVSLTVK